MTFARALPLLLALAHAPLAGAQIPDAFRPLVVEAPFALAERQFDLNPAIAKARAEKKLLFVYLGAHDCPYCVQYVRFLRANTEALLPVYSRHVVVDIRTWLKGPQPTFLVGDRKYTFAEFQSVVGGPARKQAVYPTFWLLTPDLKARPLPAGTNLFKSVDEHRKALSVS